MGNTVRNLTKQLRNNGGQGFRFAGGDVTNAKDYSASTGMLSGILHNLNGNGNKKGKSGVKATLKIVQQSTASMGRFDDLRKGELVKRIHGKRQRLKSNTHIDAEKVDIYSVFVLLWIHYSFDTHELLK